MGFNYLHHMVSIVKRISTGCRSSYSSLIHSVLIMNSLRTCEQVIEPPRCLIDSMTQFAFKVYARLSCYLDQNMGPQVKSYYNNNSTPLLQLVGTNVIVISNIFFALCSKFILLIALKIEGYEENTFKMSMSIITKSLMYFML